MTPTADQPLTPEHFDQRASGTWIALGDSFTAGTGDDRGGWIRRAHAVLAGTHRLDELVLLAEPGVSIGSVLREQAPRLEPCRIVSVIAGANDILRPHPDLDRLDQQIHELLDLALAHAEMVLTTTCPNFCLPRAHPSRKLRDRIHRLNEHVARRAASDHRLVVVDAYVILSERELWSHDKIHPNPGGHARLADAAQRQLARRLDRTR
jgi:lysophospholipase L1-like esterase